MGAVEKIHKTQAKEYEKALKVGFLVLAMAPGIKWTSH
jgi:hypothetical protein